MRMKLIKVLSVVLAVTLCSCSSLPNTINNKNEIVKKEAINTKILVGKVVFPVKSSKQFKTKAIASEVSVTATISIIDSDNKTIATGISDSKGVFKIDLNNFTVSTTEVYVLEAIKRNREKVLTIRTYIRWNGSNCESITGNETIINETTTGITIIADLSKLDKKELLSKVKTTISDISDSKGQIIINKNDITYVSNQVGALLMGDKDPIAMIKYDVNKPTKYFIEQSNNIDELLKTNSCLGCDLRNIDLTKVSLSGKNLSYSDLTGINLKGLNLSNTVLYKANLSNITLDSNTTISNTDFSNANLSGANLVGITVGDSNFSNSDFSNAKIENSDLSYGYFSGANFSNSTLIENDLTGSDLTGSNLVGTILVGKSKLTLPQAEIKETNLSGQILDNLNFYKKDLTGTILSNTNLKNSILSEVLMTGADLSGSDLSGTNLSASNLEGVKLKATKIDSKTLFTKADLSKADLTDFNLSGGNFSFANLSKQDLSKKDLSNVHFTFSSLRETNLTGANITGVNFNNANLTGITWIDGAKKTIEKFIYESEKEGSKNIYIAEQDAINEIKLGSGYKVSFSPDKSKIIYTDIDPSGNENIYIMNINGKNKIKLTDLVVNKTEGIFSSEGTKIIYSIENTGTSDIWIMNTDGTGKSNLTKSNNIINRNPSVFGNKIVFESNRDGNSQIYLMDFTGKDPDDNSKLPRNLSNNSNNETAPVLSPDGNKIAYKSDGQVKSYEQNTVKGIMWVMDANGGNKLPYDSYDGTINGKKQYQEVKSKIFWTKDSKRIMSTTYKESNHTYYMTYGNIPNYWHDWIVTIFPDVAPNEEKGHLAVSTLPKLYVKNGSLTEVTMAVIYNIRDKKDLNSYNPITDEILSFDNLAGAF